MSDQPAIGGRAPLPIQVTAGEEYWWCACGRSQNQPFCDGSHKDTGFTPVRYDAEESRTLWFCACKRTGAQPLCDGTHKTLDD